MANTDINVTCPSCGQGFYALHTMNKGPHPHTGSKACRFRQRKAQLLRDGWAPVGAYAYILIEAGLGVLRLEKGDADFAITRWGPAWAIAVCSSVDKDGARNRLVVLLKELEKNTAKHEVILALARLSGHVKVAKFLRMPKTRMAHLFPDDNPLYWMDPR